MPGLQVHLVALLLLSPPAWVSWVGKALFDDDQHEWKQAIESGDVEKYSKFLKDVNFNDSDNPLEATALEHGFIPENDGIAAVDLERRSLSSLKGSVDIRHPLPYSAQLSHQ